MITKQEPTQPKLWSRFQDLLSEVALEELDRGWQGVFHRMILKQLPIGLMEEKFNKYTGRPTKELYSVCVLLLIMNYFGWTLSQARLNHMVDLGVQYALNIEKDAVELSERTLYRYLDWQWHPILRILQKSKKNKIPSCIFPEKCYIKHHSTHL